MGSKTTLIIPIEGQARELDGKLLLACVGAEAGYSAILGSRNPIHLGIAHFPRGIYMAKGLRSSKNRMFRFARGLGHDLVAWDEEALVRFPRDDYYRRRLAAKNVALTSQLFAWGEDDAQVFRDFPGLGKTEVTITGNPRIDLLRPEIRGYFDAEVAEVRAEHGDFILINTNFGYVNAFADSDNLMRPAAEPGGDPILSDNARDMAPDFARGLARHKFALFDHFKELVPAVAAALPGHTIVVRPHPSENHDAWKRAGHGYDNVRVVHERSVIPWLMASKAVIHNGCTTALESAVLGRAAIAYRPIVDKRFDFELPNSVSHAVHDTGELLETLRKCLDAPPETTAGVAHRAIVERHISALEGPLAADRMVAALTRAGLRDRPLPRPPLLQYLKTRRAIAKRVRDKRANADRVQAYVDHRFPGTSVADLERRIGRFAERLNRFERLRVEAVAEDIFRIEG